MISQTAEYALRAMVFLAQEPEESATTGVIAEATQVPAGYLSKVLQSLARAGLVRSTRGLHGGYRLRRSPAELTILEVINAVDPLQRITACPLEIADHNEELCPLHRRLDDAMAGVEEAMGRTVLSELLVEGGRITPLCANKAASS